MRDKHARKAFLLFALVAACGSPTTAISATEDLKSQHALPLSEISGLASLGDRFVAVGDRSTSIITFELREGALHKVETHKPLPKPGKKGSQYEAVNFDGAGNVVVLSEAGEITVLDEACDRELSTSQLDWSSVSPFAHTLDHNSLGEGMLVLSASHVLVALEKNPTALVEFGPKEDAPIGFTPHSQSTLPFAPPSKLVALSYWRVDDDATPDLSELTLGPDGSLWALSQQSGSIVRFEKTLRPSEERAGVRDRFPIPSEIVGAEGLTFDGKKPVVARDRKGEKKNLYVLAPLSF